MLAVTDHARIRGNWTYVVENNERLGPAAIVIADGMEDTTTDNSRDELLKEEKQE